MQKVSGQTIKLYLEEKIERMYVVGGASSLLRFSLI